MRKIVIAGNWKMNKVEAEIDQFIDEVKDVQLTDFVDAVICAPFVYLQKIVDRLKTADLKVAAQTMDFNDSGAYTGEVSPVMLKDIGVTHVIIGHSERREYYNETDETVNKKVKAAFAHNLTPIVCVGESLETRETNKALSFVKDQVKKALDGLTDEQIQQTIIAYEPIWAIGTGKTASSEDANEVCAHIRQTIEELTSEDIARYVTIQYGGSVNPDNIDELLNTSNIDGALVGGASLEASSFLQLVEAGIRKNG